MTRRVALADDTAREAAAVLREGGLVILPLSTVYVITADATIEEAVDAVYRVKDRPRVNPFMVLVHSVEAAKELTRFNEVAERLAERFWPGPLTLSLPLREGHPIARNALVRSADSVAVCVPNSPAILKLLEEVGHPVICSSSNPSGHLTPTDPQFIADEIADAVDMVLEDGPVPIGLETTIVALQYGEPVLVRPGAVLREEIAEVVGHPLRWLHESDDAREIMRRSQIAACQVLPKYNAGVPLRLNAEGAHEGEALLGFGPTTGADLNLSEPGDLREAAGNLYGHLTRLARRDPRAIAVAPVPREGIGEAINHRLRLCARASEQGV